MDAKRVSDFYKELYKEVYWGKWPESSLFSGWNAWMWIIAMSIWELARSITFFAQVLKEKEIVIKNEIHNAIPEAIVNKPKKSTK